MKADTPIVPEKKSRRNVCKPSAALQLRLAKAKMEAAVVCLERAAKADPTLLYALNATSCEALNVVHHVNMVLRETLRVPV